MPKFRKKPVVIEAEQWDGGSIECVRAVAGLMGKVLGRVCDSSLLIETLEGKMTALPGDWIIKGVKGEFYPCKPEIFAATYERVED